MQLPAAPADHFEETRAQAREMPTLADVVLNIPIWGFPGHGKTSSILTAIQFSNATLHGIGLALVADKDDLERVAEQYPEYRADQLIDTAEASRTFLNEMKDRFFRQSEWPDATEQPAQYLLEIQTSTGTLGYAILPDIRGGSFEAVDQVSKNITRNAHGMILVIKPDEYLDEEDPRSADYRKDVLRRIQKCAQSDIPTCITITMCDMYGAAGDAGDRVHKELSLILDHQPASFRKLSKIFRVSTIGGRRTEADKQLPPPPMKERDATELMKAWTWTILAALNRPHEQIREARPQLDLRAEPDLRRLAVDPIASLREASTIDCPSGLLCAGDVGGQTFFAARTGSVTELAFDELSDTLSATRTISLGASAKPSRIECKDGTLFVSEQDPDGLVSTFWHGPRSGPLSRTSAPLPLQSWAPIHPYGMVAISPNGSIHLLRLEGTTWQVLHHVPDLTTPQPQAVCAFAEASRIAIVLTGTEAIGVYVTEGLKFGASNRPAIVCDFGRDASINSLGFHVAISRQNEIVAGREKIVTLGPIQPDWEATHTIARLSPTIAWVASGGQLRVSTIGAQRQSSPASSGPSTGELSGIALSGNADYLLVSRANNTATIFRVLGLP